MVFMFLTYSIDGTGPYIVIETPQEDFFRNEFGIWIDGTRVSDHCCQKTQLYEVWRYFELRQKQTD